VNDFLLAVGFGLVTAGILALSTVSWSLQYAVSRVPNLAHGEILTSGAYAAYVAQNYTHNLLVTALVAAAAGAVVAWLMNVIVIEGFARAGAKYLTIFIATLGASFFWQNVILMIFGGVNVAYVLPHTSPYQLGPFEWTGREIGIMVSSGAVMVLLFFLLQYTKFGKALRAVAENRELARVSGIEAHRVVMFTWLLAGVIAGYGGFVFASEVGSFTPYFGFSFLLVTVAAGVAGGLGKPYGAMAGALLVGIVMEVSAFYTAAAYKLAFAFIILVLVLLFRPLGLFSSYLGGAFQ
jgi:neutral amino acid transport system permease protein